MYIAVSWQHRNIDLVAERITFLWPNNKNTILYFCYISFDTIYLSVVLSPCKSTSFVSKTSSIITLTCLAHVEFYLHCFICRVSFLLDHWERNAWKLIQKNFLSVHKHSTLWTVFAWNAITRAITIFLKNLSD